MKIALIDNGSLEAASQRNLRAVAAAVSARVGVPVAPVSWKHSDRIPAAELDGRPAAVLSSWVRDQVSGGERQYLFVPFFISAQGSVGSSLRAEVEELALREGGLKCAFTAGFSPELLASILAARVEETVRERGLERPAVIVVDHGGPSATSARLRDRVAAAVSARLGDAARAVAPASMESPDGPPFSFNEPLFAAKLGAPGFDSGDVVIAPLFLSPGRHAGPGGDLERIAAHAGAARPSLRCQFTGLVGTHPLAAQALSLSLAGFLADSLAKPRDTVLAAQSPTQILSITS